MWVHCMIPYMKETEGNISGNPPLTAARSQSLPNPKITKDHKDGGVDGTVDGGPSR